MRYHFFLWSFFTTCYSHWLFAQVDLTSSNLPIISFHTHGLTISDEPKIVVDMGIIDHGPGRTNRRDQPPDHYFGKVGIELRGSTSQAIYPKKAYSLETRDSSGKDLKVSLLGMPPESDWNLISPLNDKTLIRDALAHHYASLVLPWSPRTRFVEVLLDDQYQGVYLFLESIKRDRNRVDINKLKPDEITGDTLTGGYLLRIDKSGPPPGTVGGDWVSAYPPVDGAHQQTWFQYRNPKADDIHPDQAAYIQQYIRDFEDMLRSDDFADRYLDWIDLDSWVDYLLVQELCKNTDGYRLSAYFYKKRDSDGGKISMGPVWDFNIAFGLGSYCDGELSRSWAKDFNRKCSDNPNLIHFWWERLWNEPKFRQRIAERWQEHRASVWSDEKLFGVIDSLTTLLKEPQQRNFQRWPVLGEYVWPNYYIGKTFQEEMDYLRTWFTNRLKWLDSEIPRLTLQSQSSR
jgi:spore coat protein CotH